MKIASGVAVVAAAPESGAVAAEPLTVYTFGDSVLDCRHYNAHGVHPGQLVVRNDDRLSRHSRVATWRRTDRPASNTAPWTVRP
jgi:hypothetical protein